MNCFANFQNVACTVPSRGGNLANKQPAGLGSLMHERYCVWTVLSSYYDFHSGQRSTHSYFPYILTLTSISAPTIILASLELCCVTKLHKALLATKLANIILINSDLLLLQNGCHIVFLWQVLIKKQNFDIFISQKVNLSEVIHIKGTAVNQRRVF